MRNAAKYTAIIILAALLFIALNPGVLIEWIYLFKEFILSPETGACVLGSANFLSDRGEFRNNAAWHKAGNVFTGDQSLVDAASKHWSDIKIHKLKVYSPYPFLTDAQGNDLESGFDVRPIEVEGQFNIFRAPIPEDPNPMFLGQVSKTWETRNPMWYARKLNDLSEKISARNVGNARISRPRIL